MADISITRYGLAVLTVAVMMSLLLAMAANAQIYSNPDFGADQAANVRSANNPSGANTGGTVNTSGSAGMNADNTGSANTNTNGTNAGLPDTGGAADTGTPGLPETGAGGNALMTLAILIASVAAFAGGAWALRQKLV